MRYLLIAVLLAGCATPEQRASSAKWYADNIYSPRCEGAGLPKGTEQHRACVVGMTIANTR